MRICTKCVLPDTFPGITFDEQGVCNFCRDFKGVEHLKHKKAEYRTKFAELVNQYKGKNSYDALMCYSGGKDSTYTLTILKETFGLEILAITFDNGFIPEQTFKNIRNVVENLGIDHIFFKPRFDILRKIFSECAKNNIYPPKTLERASAICTSCMGIVKFSALRFALEKEIPFIAFGWSPGQAPIESSIMKNNPQMVKMMQKTIFESLHRLVGDEINQYFLEERHFKDSYSFPYNINPLAFLEYNEEKIYQKIYKLGWESPQETDANSTNCLLNSFANVIHKKQFNFHPYAFEMAKLVRENYVGREVALEKINKSESPETIEFVRQKMNMKILDKRDV
jgi:tRNA(Ile)-lysidine synthase TilS/MesJ